MSEKWMKTEKCGFIFSEVTITFIVFIYIVFSFPLGSS